MSLKHLAGGAAVYAALLAAAPAVSAQSNTSGYSEPAGSVQQQIRHHDPSVHAGAPDNDAGALPFTGLDLGLVGGAGALLLVIGLGVRRLVGVQMP